MEKKLDRNEEVIKYSYLSKNIADINEIIGKYVKHGYYNVFLYMHLGDNFYVIYAVKQMKEKEKIHFIIRPKDVILMKLWNITNYTICDEIDEYLKERIGKYYPGPAYIREFIYFHAIEHNMPLTPEKDNAFIVFQNQDKEFMQNVKKRNGILFLRLLALGITDNIKINPKEINYPKLSDETRKKFEAAAPLNKTVLLLTETKSSDLTDKKIWEVIIKELSKLGYTVIENVMDKKNHTKGAINVDFELDELIQIGMNCHKVISIRNGLCDILVGKGEDLIILEPEAQYNRSLKRLFLYPDNFEIEPHKKPIEIILTNNKKPSLIFDKKDILKKVRWRIKDNSKLSFRDYIYSVRKENRHKVTRILGFKIKKKETFGG